MTYTMLENAMAIGEYYPDVKPIYECPHCHHMWYDTGDGWVEDGDGDYAAYNGDPKHGKGCVGCAYESRTAEDAMAYVLEQDESNLRDILKAIVEDVGAMHLLKMISREDPDLLMQTAEEWANAQDEYFDWILHNK